MSEKIETLTVRSSPLGYKLSYKTIPIGDINRVKTGIPDSAERWIFLPAVVVSDSSWIHFFRDKVAAEYYALAFANELFDEIKKEWNRT